MRRINTHFIASLFVSALLVSSCGSKENEYAWVKNAIDVSAFQLKQQAADVVKAAADTALFPRTIVDGKLQFVGTHDWTSGFYPGSLWYAYELSGDDSLKTEARRFTNRLFDLQFYTGTHDLGFMMYCSYGNALRIDPLQNDEQIVLNTSKSLATRFSPTVGLIRSWDFGAWSYPVIIDNMMNLEMLFWATKHSGDSTYYKIATSHADLTMEHHFRSDMSTYHVLSYVPESGAVESKGTFQGYDDSSAWARGQAWGLYGYTVCFRETGDPKYLDRARAIASFIMSHPSIPADHIPYWDYNAPNIPDAPRDASAAAVTASALLELSTYVADGSSYVNYAEAVLKTLSGEEYLAKKGQNAGFILMHSTGFLPGNSEIDVPINYADYYYLEALKRYLELKGIDPKTLV